MMKPTRPDRLSRRALLRCAGAAAATAPFLRTGAAHGQNIPRRLLVLYTADGLRADLWKPTGSGASFQLGKLFKPLDAYRNDLVFFDHLDMVSTYYDPTGPGNAHRNGTTHALTGSNRFAGGDLPGAPSLDQTVARALRDSGVLTRVPSLELHASYVSKVQTGIAAAAGTEMPHIAWPQDAFKRAFPEGISTGMPVVVDDAPVRKQQRMMALARQDFTRLQGRLSGPDREKITQHLDAISDLEKRLILPTSGGGRGPGEEFRALPSAAKPGDASAQWQFRTEWHIKVAAAALHADAARVVTLNIDDPPAALWGYSDGMYGSENPHDLTHKVNDAGLVSGEGADAIERSKVVLMERIGLVMDQLAGRTESDGKRLLDHTCVLFCGHIANGSHTIQNLPWFIGGGTDHFKGGQFIPFSPTMRSINGKNRLAGRAHNDVLNLAANYMGLNLDRYGNPEAATGPMREALRA